MPSLNKVFLIGNLTRDPELRFTTQGTAIASFGIAVNRKYTDKAGQTQEETLFIDADAWGKLAETIGNHLTKGRLVHLEGHLKLDQWETSEGQKRQKIKLVVENFIFLDWKDERGNGTGELSKQDKDDGVPF